MDLNARLKTGLENGMVISSVIDIWDTMQVALAIIINSDVPGLAQYLQPQRKIRSYLILI